LHEQIAFCLNDARLILLKPSVNKTAGIVHRSSELADIDQRVRAEKDLSRLILRLRPEGILPLATHAELQRRLVISKPPCFRV
jgi:hypothetical protein